MKQLDVQQSAFWGTGAAAGLLLLFVLAVRLLSGSFSQVRLQFSEIGVYLVLLALGFGVQIALWRFLRLRHKKHMQTHGIPVVSGATSGIAMLACCTHYLVNLLPFLGLVGLAGFLTNYQTEILVGSIGLNLLGIAYMASMIHKHHTSSAQACH